MQQGEWWLVVGRVKEFLQTSTLNSLIRGVLHLTHWLATIVHIPSEYFVHNNLVKLQRLYIFFILDTEYLITWSVNCMVMATICFYPDYQPFFKIHLLFNPKLTINVA